MREFDQVIGHARHRRDYRHYLTAFPLRFEETTCDVTDSLRRTDGSATVFLNNQAHVRNAL
jgi:hypothetical protein